MATRRVSWITQVWEIMKDDVPKVDELDLKHAYEPSIVSTLFLLRLSMGNGSD